VTKRILVTGGAGFLGSALVHRLVADGHDVVVLDDLSRGSRRNMVDGAEYRMGSVCSEPLFLAPVFEADTVWHLAAVNGTAHFYSDPSRVLDVQIRGTQNVLDACKANGIKDLVLFSSSEVYATPPTIPTPEHVPFRIPDLTNPRFSYSAGKIAAEFLCWYSAIERVTVIRPHNIYGSGMGYEHVIPELTMQLASLAEGEAAHIADPWSTRAFCHVSDFIDGTVTAWERAGGSRNVFHIGTEQETQIFELAAMICDCLGRPEPSWHRVEGAEGSPERRCPDTSRVRSLGWAPKVKLVDGLRETVAAYLACREQWPKREVA